ncbi:hypothetical protein [Trichococcus flocculiformis]|nr:hypothetical protein [Trichococcus flocculiformis]HRF52672.1 hypothetical protein [Trichococcus flocculiformis]
MKQNKKESGKLAFSSWSPDSFFAHAYNRHREIQNLFLQADMLL